MGAVSGRCLLHLVLIHEVHQCRPDQEWPCSQPPRRRRDSPHSPGGIARRWLAGVLVNPVMRTCFQAKSAMTRTSIWRYFSRLASLSASYTVTMADAVVRSILMPSMRGESYHPTSPLAMARSRAMRSPGYFGLIPAIS